MTKSKSKQKRKISSLSSLNNYHTRITHKYLMAKKELPQCLTCGVNLIVKHIKTECHKYLEDCIKILIIPANLNAALCPNTEDTNSIINFLKSRTVKPIIMNVK